MAGMNTRRGAPTVVDSTVASSRNIGWVPPIALFVVGGLALLFGFFCVTIQLQTTEANLQGLAILDAFKPNLAVLMQPWDLLTSDMPWTSRMADITAWIIEIATWIFIVGYSDALDVSGSSGWVMQRFWFIASWALFSFNFMSDYKYGTIPGASNPTVGHLEFAVGISAAVMFFPLIGLHLIRKALAMVRA